ncbi:MAG TPA: hypothetical protein VFX50_02590, partial [Gemmatimonadales bacterium]|nr:hypothetical protein [Gemmatimonadales bacterium]
AVSFQLRGLSGSSQLVAYGRTGPLAVKGSADTVVRMAVRKPLAYVGGSNRRGEPLGITVQDTAGPLSGSSPILAGTEATSAVTTRWDGTELLTAGGGAGSFQAVLIDTRSHLEVKKATLSAAASSVAMSGDGRFAAVAHPEAGRVSLIDLGQLRGPEPLSPVRTIDGLRTPGVVAIGGAGTFALLGRPTAAPKCTPAPAKTALVAIDVAAGTAGAEVDTGVAGRDLALENGGNRVFVTDPCTGRVLAFPAGMGAGEKLFDLPGARSLAAHARKLVVTGATTTPVRATVSQYDLDTAMVTTHAIQMPDERYELPLSDPEMGQAIELRVEPDEVEVHDVAISPDGQKAVLLVHTFFRQEPFFILLSQFPGSDINAYYVMTVDLQSGAVISRVRSDCTVRFDDALTTLYRCEAAADSVEPARGAEYVASSAAILWGSH